MVIIVAGVVTIVARVVTNCDYSGESGGYW